MDFGDMLIGSVVFGIIGVFLLIALFAYINITNISRESVVDSDFDSYLRGLDLLRYDHAEIRVVENENNEVKEIQYKFVKFKYNSTGKYDTIITTMVYDYDKMTLKSVTDNSNVRIFKYNVLLPILQKNKLKNRMYSKLAYYINYV